MKSILYIIASFIALLIYISPICIIGLAIYLIVKDFRKKNSNRPKKNNTSNRTQHINPQWERVIREDGTEYFRLKRNNTGTAVTGGQVTAFRKYPYKKRDLLTPIEQNFWKILKNVCDANNLLICPKVRMEDFIEVEEKEYASKQKFRAKIKSRHIDFMICDKNLNVLAGIELDDSTHNRKAAQETDAFKNQVFTDIQIPLYRVKVKSGTNIAYLGEVTQIIKEITEQNILPIK